jgi:hypothetical protein
VKRPVGSQWQQISIGNVLSPNGTCRQLRLLSTQRKLLLSTHEPKLGAGNPN